MKSFSLKAAESILKVLARWTIVKYQPGIVGFTGSVGKTSAKEATRAVLLGTRRMRASRGNFNGQIGLPLAILGDWKDEDMHLLSREHSPGKDAFRKFLFLSKVVLISALKLIFGVRSVYPELLILEYGADRPGDIKRLMEIARPQIAVVTAVGEIPAHVEFYQSPEQVAREKSRLVENLPSNGFAILNADDDMVSSMRERTRAHVITFGFSEDAEVRITNFEHRVTEGKPAGIAFKLNYGGSFVPVRMPHCFGRPPAMAAAAAAAVGLVFGAHLVKIAEALSAYQSPPHRMKLLAGVRGTTIMDDSYNASPLSMAAAIDTAKSIGAARKVAVLGDMLEIGEYAIQAHEEIGRRAAKVFDMILTVGPRAKFIAEAALAAGKVKKSVLSFNDANEVVSKFQDLIKNGDLILIKASWGMHLDRIVHAIKQL